MRDHGYKLRKAFFTALNTHVTLNTHAVPVVDGKLETIPEDRVSIVFGDQSDVDRSNKSAFVVQTTFDIAVVDKRKATSSRQDVDDVCDQILNIVKPTITSTGLSIESPFVISTLSFLTGLSLRVQVEQNVFIQVKRIQFIIRVTQ
jgi:hypothetical protein